MSEPTRYDLWLMEVTDPAAALEALTEALGDRSRARDAVLSTPAMLLHGASAEDAQGLATRLQGAGVLLETRPSRRAAPLVEADLSPTGTSAQEPLRGAAPTPRTGPATRASLPNLHRPPATEGELGVAKVSYTSALVAAPAYLLQGRVLAAVLALAIGPALLLMLPGALVGLLHASGFAVLLTTLLVVLTIVYVYCGVFALIVRRSHEGQTDLRMGDETTADLWAATMRFFVVTLLLYAPVALASCLVSFSPTIASLVVAGLLSLLNLVLAVALPGSYAMAAIGSGCAGVTPISGLRLMQRIPGPYFLTLFYLWVVQLVSGALSVVPYVAVVTSAMALGENPTKQGLLLALSGLSMMAIFAGSMILSARVMGLLTYHYSEELGL